MVNQMTLNQAGLKLTGRGSNLGDSRTAPRSNTRFINGATDAAREDQSLQILVNTVIHDYAVPAKHVE